MIAAARISFVFASVTMILVGLIHTAVQVAYLQSPELIAHLRAFGAIPEVLNAYVDDLWLGLSHLMGYFAITLGFVNLAAFQLLDRDQPPTVLLALPNMMMGVAVGIIGLLYLSAFQMFGGPLQIVLFGLALIARNNR